MQKNNHPLVFVISGPSGVGKDVILQQMKDANPPYFFAVTATTRLIRTGETNGADYIFVDRAKFEKMMENDELLEWANVYGNLYGVPRMPVEDALASGKDVILKVDIQGAATVREKLPESVLIFIAPPSLAELEWRLRSRKTEASVDLERRLSEAREEMKSRESFDYVVVSQRDQVPQVISQIEAIIAAEKSKVRS